jgi:hypothetical protein
MSCKLLWRGFTTYVTETLATGNEILTLQVRRR